MKRILLVIPIILFAVTSIKAQYIPDLTPVDVYLNFEKIGYTIEKDIGSDYGNFWTAKNNSGSVNYTVEINSDDVNKVQSIRATARNANYNHKQAKQFLQYTASVLAIYGTASKSTLDGWINSNYNSAETSTTFGNVTVKIMAPSQTFRILKISAN
jgi:hypothetical protein